MSIPLEKIRARLAEVKNLKEKAKIHSGSFANDLFVDQEENHRKSHKSDWKALRN